MLKKIIKIESKVNEGREKQDFMIEFYLNQEKDNKNIFTKIPLANFLIYLF